MTLCIALINERVCVVCSDRRITSNGKIVGEEHDKAFCLFTKDGRAAVTFSGVATAGSFRTHEWLIEAVKAAGPPDYNLGGIAERLTLRLTDTFKTHPVLKSLSPQARRLSVMTAGYIYRDNSYICAYAKISNFERPDDPDAQPAEAAADEFGLFQGTTSTDNPTVTIAIGDTTALKVDDFVDIRGAAKAGETGQAIALKLVDVIRKAAKSGNLVGSQVSSLVLSPNLAEVATANYHSAVVKDAFEIPALVWVQDGQPSSVSKIKVEPNRPSQAPPIAVPQVGRNKPCPCRSGKKYKQCHGKR